MALLAISLVLISIGTAVYYWLQHNDAVSAAEFAKRNLKFIKLTNMFKALLTKERIEESHDKVIKREGPVFGFTMLNKYTVMVADPDIVQTVLSKEFTSFQNRRQMPVINKLMVENVAMTRDEQWKRLRSIITPTFSVGKLKQMKPCIDVTIKTMVANFDAQIKESSIQNVKNLFGAFTIDTIIQVAFGVKVDSLNDPTNPLNVYGRNLFQNGIKLLDLFKLTVIVALPKLADFIHVELLSKEMNYFKKMSIEIMSQKRAEFAKAKSFSKASSFIEFMLEAESEFAKLVDVDENENEVKKSVKFMTNDEIVSQCVIFFLAGFETTAMALSISAYQLALNPETQEKLYQETMAVFKKLKSESPDESDIYKLVTYDSLSKFEYLNAVINEALRLDPPAYFLERTATKDCSLSSTDGQLNVSVKMGDVVHIPIWTLHRDAANFPEPEKFKPERFIGEPEFHKYAYLPFGGGPRNCIARSMALMETRLALLHVIRNYKFEVCEKTAMPLKFTRIFDGKTVKEVNLRIVKRI